MMKTILKTNRLILREFQATDKFSIFELNNDSEVLRYTGDNSFESVDLAELFIKNYTHYEQFGYGRWAVILKLDGNFAGWCGLRYNPDLMEVDLGFRFFRKYWNYGYATEAAKACIEYGFTQLHLKKIIGRAMNENTGSINVLAKAGMHFEKEIDFYGKSGSSYAIYNSNY